MPRILVVEDEPQLALGLEDDLKLEGYEVEVARDGQIATERALSQRFDLIILDVMLPRKDGFEVCRDLRRAGLRMPIVMLTAKTQESDKVLGLDLGADDYVTKPFSPRELRARMRAILRQRRDWRPQRGDLDEEVRLASEVQQRLFPQFRPPFATLDYVAFCQPASGMSADYYDFLDLAPGRLGLLVADVAGKGISAALLMASLHASVRTHAPLLADRCGEVLTKVNALLYEATGAERFATLFYAVYDEASRALTYANAGHEPPLLFRARPAPDTSLAGGKAAGRAPAPSGGDSEQSQPICLRLASCTPPLGILPTLPVVQESIQLGLGDWLLIFSDGITEAFNEKGEEFGRERLLEVVACSSERSAREMRDAILEKVSSHSGGRPQSDDLTLVVAHVL